MLLFRNLIIIPYAQKSTNHPDAWYPLVLTKLVLIPSLEARSRELSVIGPPPLIKLDQSEINSELINSYRELMSRKKHGGAIQASGETF